MSIVIFPNTLFKINYYPTNIKIKEIFICECNQYFKKYTYNAKRIMLHRASMKYYYDYISINFPNITLKYIDSCNYNNFISENKSKQFFCFNPIDEIKDLFNVKLLENPSFILTKDHYKKFYDKSHNFIFSEFYLWGIKNMKKGILPYRKKITINVGISDIVYIEEARNYTINFSKTNKLHGNVNNFDYLISHKSIDEYLDIIIKNNLLYSEKTNSYVNVSTFLNIGLLTPVDILNKISKNKISKISKNKKIPKIQNINMFNQSIIKESEGFIDIRKKLLIRDFQRYCFIYRKNWLPDNYFKNTTTRLNNCWYNGNIGLKPIDEIIKMIIGKGFLNYVIRCVVIGNYMILSDIIPLHAFNWFIELFVDSYEWVMYKNVYDLLYYNKCIIMDNNSYMVSSTIIKKITKCNNGEWEKKWDTLFCKYYNLNELWDFKDFMPVMYKLK